MLTLAIIIVSLLFPSSSIDVLRDNDPRVLGVCGRPHLPPTAKLAVNKDRFTENETVQFSCRSTRHVRIQTCRHGIWQSRLVRFPCFKRVNSPLVRFEAYKCDDLSKPLLIKNVSQINDLGKEKFSFHISQVPETLQLISNGSNCYRWRLKLEKPVEISGVKVLVNNDRVDDVSITPNLTVRVAHRTCNLGDVNKADFKTVTTDIIEMEIESSANLTIRLQSLALYETFKIEKQTGKHLPDCGKPGATRLGVLERLGSDYSYFSCNSSMVDVTPDSEHLSERGEYRQTCNANAIWTGTHPQCVPKQMCSKEEITADLDDSVKIKAVGNVYYTNDTHWEAINYTWVSYVCSDPHAFLFGNPNRVCLNGTWTNSVPQCFQGQYGPFPSSLSMWFILTIVSVITIIVVLIAYLAILFYKKQFRQKLETTREKIEQSVLNETVLGNHYSDPEAYRQQLRDDSVGEDYLKLYDTIPAYEGGVKYISMAEQVNPRGTDYTDMSVKIKQSNCASSKCTDV